MQYIPLADFFGFSIVQPPLTAAQRETMAVELEQLYASGKTITAGGKSIRLDEAISFLNLLDHPGIVVFDQWIMQFSGVKNLLVNGTLTKNNFDPKISSEHRLFPDFSRFISIFLLPAVMKKLDAAEDPDFLLIAGYLRLLDADAKLIAQDKLSSWLKNKLSSALTAAKSARTEKELAQEINFVVSDEVIEFVNQFDKSFYAVKIAYIDQMLQIITLPACTQRLGAWISGQLKKLQLNPEHLEKINEITGTVNEGNVRFSNQSGKASLHFGLVRIWSIVGILFIGGIFYLLWFHPFERSEQDKVATNKSSFEQFTKEERMQLDSLIKSASSPEKDEIEEYVEDKFMHLPPADMNVIYREPYKNAKAEQFHADCLRDEALLESGQIDSCTAYPSTVFKKKNYPDFQKLSENKGFQPMFLLNESAYQVLILVFRNEASAPVFSAVIDSGDKLTFKMNPGEVVLFLPGNDWASFQASSTVGTELPSENFKHHFCLQDENFKAMLYAPYRLKTVNQKTVKLLLNESPQGDSDFFLLDLYEALEALR